VKVYNEVLDLQPTLSDYALEGSTPSLTNSTISFKVNVKGPAPPARDLRLHAVVIEDNLYWMGWDGKGEGSNGIDIHRFVARDILEPIQLADLNVNHNLSFDIEPSWDTNELGYVLFIQDNDTLEILQAIAHYPNPIEPSSGSDSPNPGFLMIMAVIGLTLLFKSSRRAVRFTPRNGDSK